MVLDQYYIMQYPTPLVAVSAVVLKDTPGGESMYGLPFFYKLADRFFSAGAVSLLYTVVTRTKMKVQHI